MPKPRVVKLRFMDKDPKGVYRGPNNDDGPPLITVRAGYVAALGPETAERLLTTFPDDWKKMPADTPLGPFQEDSDDETSDDSDGDDADEG